MEGQAAQEVPQGYGCPLDQETQRNSLRLQVACKGGQENQAHREVYYYISKMIQSLLKEKTAKFLTENVTYH